MIRTAEQLEDTDIQAAINSVASYSSMRHKRALVQRMNEDIASEVTTARLQGASIDTTDLFLRLAERYVNKD